MNHVTLSGNITRIDELKAVPTKNDDTEVLNIGLAVDNAHAPGSAGFFEIEVWGTYASVQAEHLEVGQHITLEGSLRQHRWETEGQNRSKISIKATTIEWGYRPSNKASDQAPEVE